MDERMMKAGGREKREELVKAFGNLSISNTNVRAFTEKEKRVA
jgi:hypothetical protein